MSSDGDVEGDAQGVGGQGAKTWADYSESDAGLMDTTFEESEGEEIEEEGKEEDEISEAGTEDDETEVLKQLEGMCPARVLEQFKEWSTRRKEKMGYKNQRRKGGG